MFTFLLKYEQITAISLAIILHIVIALCTLFNKTQNISFMPQSLQVNLVAPSSSLHTTYQPKINANQKVEKTNAKFSKETAKENMQDKKTESIERKTSGKESSKADSLNSAITEPIFNAVYLNNPAPVYPPSAKKNNIEGKVLLLVEVSPEGFTKNIQISQSSGYSILDNSAKNAVLSWKFIPAKQYGKPINASVIIPIEFKLN